MTLSGKNPVTNEEGAAALLIVYGAYETQDGKHLTGEAIFDSLVRNGYWLTPRIPTRTREGIRVVFYQAGAGFRATARVVRTEASRHSDWVLPGANPIMLFPKKIVLQGVRVFTDAVPAKGLLDELTFIRHKTHWGHAFRLSPRIIPDSDVDVIVRAANA
jgi:hypothetical protein